jgi:long-chain acyl-CoA synthetase
MQRASNLGELLGDLAVRHPDCLAVACDNQTLTFAQLDAEADRWASALRAAGVGPGKHVGLLAANGVDWPSVAFGVWRAGATLIPISTFVTPRELEEILRHADVDLLVTQPRLRSHDYLATVSAIDTARLERIVVLTSAATSFTSSTEFLEGRNDTPRDSVDPASIACILYTSGTTGRPKGVRLSHRAILATVFPTALRSGLTHEDSMLSTLPLFWVAGLVIRALPTWAAGCGLLFVETFTPEGVLELITKHRPTALHLRPNPFPGAPRQWSHRLVRRQSAR